MKPIQVGLLGIGTVGSGTFSVLQRNQEEIRRRAGRGIEITMVADLDTERARNIVGDETLTAASAGVRAASGFLQYHLTPDGWKCHRALLPDQPEDGFTVSANESQEQIDLLCATYESGNDEAKRMTRMIAEVSVTR